MSSLTAVIKKHVLKNACDYGKANPGAVVGKVIAEFPDAKNDMKATMIEINNIIADISKLSKEQIADEMKKYEYIKKEEVKKDFKLENAQKVITRFPPEPSGYPHIGHAKAAFLDYMFAKDNSGQMILRFDDTNPEKESLEYMDAIREGLAWLGINWIKETYTSDNIELIYESAEKLISKNKAYVSIASQEEISEMRTTGKPIECRNLSAKEHLFRWEEMLAGKLKAVLLYKGNLEADNTVMRDPTLARLITKKHYRQGKRYLIWPSYDLAVVVMDYMEGITHSMRSKEYELRNELYFALFDALDWKKPELIEFSRLAIKNAPVSKRLLAPLVQNHQVSGWDDPRLPTLTGLKRRGILPEAIREFVLSFGLSKVESEPGLEKLLAENRKILDPEAGHFFFVKDPVLVEITGVVSDKLVLKSHPKKDDRTRTLEIGSKIYIAKDDADKLTKGEIVRLKDWCNIEILEKGKHIKANHVADGQVPKKIQWVPPNGVKCEVIMPKDLLQDGKYNPASLEKIKGLCESDCLLLEEGEIIQFERFGFCRLDKRNKNSLVFIYSC